MPYTHLPAGHQLYHNEENMSKTCLQNYEVPKYMRLHIIRKGGVQSKTIPHDISSYAIIIILPFQKAMNTGIRFS
jgi:hypothetical protein